MALLILALLQRIFLMSSLMLLLVWLIFFMVLIKLLPILGTISGKTVKLMVLALICLGNNRQDRSEERFSRNAETDLVCRLLLEKKKPMPPTLSAPSCLCWSSSSWRCRTRLSRDYRAAP